MIFKYSIRFKLFENQSDYNIFDENKVIRKYFYQILLDKKIICFKSFFPFIIKIFCSAALLFDLNQF